MSAAVSATGGDVAAKSAAAPRRPMRVRKKVKPFEADIPSTHKSKPVAKKSSTKKPNKRNAKRKASGTDAKSKTEVAIPWKNRRSHRIAGGLKYSALFDLTSERHTKNRLVRERTKLINSLRDQHLADVQRSHISRYPYVDVNNVHLCLEILIGHGEHFRAKAHDVAEKLANDSSPSIWRPQPPAQPSQSNNEAERRVVHVQSMVEVEVGNEVLIYGYHTDRFKQKDDSALAQLGCICAFDEQSGQHWFVPTTAQRLTIRSKEPRWIDLRAYRVRVFAEDVVWAKLNRFPSWPGRVVRDYQIGGKEVGGSRNPHVRRVEFITANNEAVQTSTVKKSDIRPWTQQQAQAEYKNSLLAASVDMAAEIATLRRRFQNKAGIELARKTSTQLLLTSMDSPEKWLSQRIDLFWPNDAEWYHGTISMYNIETRRHLVRYDDGYAEWVVLADQIVRLRHPELWDPSAKPLSPVKQSRRQPAPEGYLGRLTGIVAPAPYKLDADPLVALKITEMVCAECAGYGLPNASQKGNKMVGCIRCSKSCHARCYSRPAHDTWKRDANNMNEVKKVLALGEDKALMFPSSDVAQQPVAVEVSSSQQEDSVDGVIICKTCQNCAFCGMWSNPEWESHVVEIPLLEPDKHNVKNIKIGSGYYANSQFRTPEMIAEEEEAEKRAAAEEAKRLEQVRRDAAVAAALAAEFENSNGVASEIAGASSELPVKHHETKQGQTTDSCSFEEGSSSESESSSSESDSLPQTKSNAKKSNGKKARNSSTKKETSNADETAAPPKKRIPKKKWKPEEMLTVGNRRNEMVTCDVCCLRVHLGCMWREQDMTPSDRVLVRAQQVLEDFTQDFYLWRIQLQDGFICPRCAKCRSCSQNPRGDAKVVIPTNDPAITVDEIVTPSVEGVDNQLSPDFGDLPVSHTAENGVNHPPNGGASDPNGQSSSSMDVVPVSPAEELPVTRKSLPRASSQSRAKRKGRKKPAKAETFANLREAVVNFTQWIHGFTFCGPCGRAMGGKGCDATQFCPVCCLRAGWEDASAEMICCDGCGRWEHTECAGLTPSLFELYATTDEQYLCDECRLRDDCVDMHTLLDHLAKLDKNRHFLLPITADVVDMDTYLQLIKKPIDFTTISNNVRDFKYATLEEFKHDLNLIWRNAKDYNDDRGPVWRAAQRLQLEASALLVQLQEKIARRAVLSKREKKMLVEEQFEESDDEDLMVLATSANVTAMEVQHDDDESAEPLLKKQKRVKARVKASRRADVHDVPLLVAIYSYFQTVTKITPSQAWRTGLLEIESGGIDVSPPQLPDLPAIPPTAFVDACLACGGVDDHGSMLVCRDCGEAIHIFCLDATLELNDERRSLEWTCPNCVLCSACNGLAAGDGEKGKELVMCDLCDRGFHLDCVDPPLKGVPRGDWRCENCVCCRACGSATPNGNMENAPPGVLRSALNMSWTYDFKFCGPCGSAYKRGNVCSACEKPWRSYMPKDRLGEMVCCESCNKWVHQRCDKLLNDDVFDVLCAVGSEEEASELLYGHLNGIELYSTVQERSLREARERGDVVRYDELGLEDQRAVEAFVKLHVLAQADFPAYVFSNEEDIVAGEREVEDRTGVMVSASVLADWKAALPTKGRVEEAGMDVPNPLVLSTGFTVRENRRRPADVKPLGKMDQKDHDLRTAIREYAIDLFLSHESTQNVIKMVELRFHVTPSSSIASSWRDSAVQMRKSGLRYCCPACRRQQKRSTVGCSATNLRRAGEAYKLRVKAEAAAIAEAKKKVEQGGGLQQQNGVISSESSSMPGVEPMTTTAQVTASASPPVSMLSVDVPSVGVDDGTVSSSTGKPSTPGRRSAREPKPRALFNPAADVPVESMEPEPSLVIVGSRHAEPLGSVAPAQSNMQYVQKTAAHKLSEDVQRTSEKKVAHTVRQSRAAPRRAQDAGARWYDNVPHDEAQALYDTARRIQALRLRRRSRYVLDERRRGRLFKVMKSHTLPLDPRITIDALDTFMQPFLDSQLAEQDELLQQRRLKFEDSLFYKTQPNIPFSPYLPETEVKVFHDSLGKSRRVLDALVHVDGRGSGKSSSGGVKRKASSNGTSSSKTPAKRKKGAKGSKPTSWSSLTQRERSAMKSGYFQFIARGCSAEDVRTHIKKQKNVAMNIDELNKWVREVELEDNEGQIFEEKDCDDWKDKPLRMRDAIKDEVWDHVRSKHWSRLRAIAYIRNRYRVRMHLGTVTKWFKAIYGSKLPDPMDPAPKLLSASEGLEEDIGLSTHVSTGTPLTEQYNRMRNPSRAAAFPVQFTSATSATFAGQGNPYTANESLAAIPDFRKCDLCNRIGAHEDDDLKFVIWRLMPVDAFSDHQRWVHVFCAVWCHEVFEDQARHGSLKLVKTQMKKSQELKCSFCGDMGAGISCAHGKCKLLAHLPCALKQGFVFQFDGRVMCSEHRDKATPAKICLPLSGSRRRFLVPPRNISDSRRVTWARTTDWSTSSIVLRCGSLMVHALGQIEAQSNYYHTMSYLHPPGFQSTRLFWSYKRPEQRTVIFFTIKLNTSSMDVAGLPKPVGGDDADDLLRGSGSNDMEALAPPHFIVYILDDMAHPIVASSPTRAFLMLVARYQSTQWIERNKNRVLTLDSDICSFGLNAPHFFGFGHPEVVPLLEQRDNVKKCTMYRFNSRSSKSIFGAAKSKEAQEFRMQLAIEQKAAESKELVNLSGSFRSEGYIKGGRMQHKDTAVDFHGVFRAPGSELPWNHSVYAKTPDVASQGNVECSSRNRSIVLRKSDASEDKLTEKRDITECSIEEQYFFMKHCWESVIRVGHSDIHMWGLFTKIDFKANEMVIEYLGELIRPVVSDLREKRYESSGIGSTYMFRLSEEWIVDATREGNISRFINHSCDPNCYTQIIDVKGQKKIVVIAHRPIEAGEEITYNYFFASEEDSLRCKCGAINCTGRLN